VSNHNTLASGKRHLLASQLLAHTHNAWKRKCRLFACHLTSLSGSAPSIWPCCHNVKGLAKDKWILSQIFISKHFEVGRPEDCPHRHLALSYWIRLWKKRGGVTTQSSEACLQNHSFHLAIENLTHQNTPNFNLKCYRGGPWNVSINKWQLQSCVVMKADPIHFFMFL